MPRNGEGGFSKLAGTDGVPDQTISSAAYNAFTDDIVADLNFERPIVVGGTGARNIADARENLGGEDGPLVTADGDEKMRNKRLQRRKVTATLAATITPNIDTTDLLDIVGLNDNVTIANPTGTPDDCDFLELRITPATDEEPVITWGDKYRSGGSPLPTAMVANTRLRMLFEYHAGDVKYDMIAVDQQALA